MVLSAFYSHRLYHDSVVGRQCIAQLRLFFYAACRAVLFGNLPHDVSPPGYARAENSVHAAFGQQYTIQIYHST